jgi:7-cyano-7-deazaguanine synthase
MKCVIIISGGLDSVVLLHHIAKTYKYDEIYALTYNYGQRLIREIDCASYQAATIGVIAHKIVDLSFFKDIASTSAITNMNIKVPTANEVVGDAQSATYVPNRNMMMLSIAAAYAESVEADTVFYGAQGADSTSGYWDASPEFLEAINMVLNLNRKNKIKISAPFIDWDKTAIVQEGIKYGVDFKQTHTCYEGTEIACGRCVSDANRIQAFLNAGYIDPIQYAVDIPWAEYKCLPLSENNKRGEKCVG